MRKPTKLTKPTRPPPPPPRDHFESRAISPTPTFCSLQYQVDCRNSSINFGGGSECAESVYSAPVLGRHQPSSCYQTCCSSSVRSVCCNSPCQSFCSNYSSIHYLPRQSCVHCTVPPIVAACTMSCGSPCSQIIANTHSHSQQVPVNLGSKPTPKLRAPRPKICLSPLPVRKNNQMFMESRSYDKYKPSFYRRHMEQHVQRVFKYLEERETRYKMSHSGGINEAAEKLLRKKESSHLRSRRKRVTEGDFEHIQKLGAGFIGDVWLVKKRSSINEYFAMKRLKKSQVFQQNHLAHIMAERDILAEADNEWIVKLFFSFQDSHYLYFILEYIAGGDMMNLLCKKLVFSEDLARFYIAEISLAVQFVHTLGFIHRDIKPDNILIDKEGHIKLTDFGLCTGFRWTHDSRYYRDDTLAGPTHHNEHPTITKELEIREKQHALRKRSLSLVGSPNYIAPEVLRQAFYPNTLQNSAGTNEKLCDWWSVGVILYEMVIGYCPFIDLKKVKQGIYNPCEDPPENIQSRILNWKQHLAFPSLDDPDGPPLIESPDKKKKYIEPETKDLIQGLLCDAPERFCQNGLEDIQNHKFFEGINWAQIRSMKAPYQPRLDHPMDTRHFDISPYPSDHPAYSRSSLASDIVSDFTYKSFW